MSKMDEHKYNLCTSIQKPPPLYSGIKLVKIAIIRVHNIGTLSYLFPVPLIPHLNGLPSHSDQVRYGGTCRERHFAALTFLLHSLGLFRAIARTH